MRPHVKVGWCSVLSKFGLSVGLDEATSTDVGPLLFSLSYWVELLNPQNNVEQLFTMHYIAQFRGTYLPISSCLLYYL